MPDARISIHALLAESDLTVAAHFGRRKLFLSTLSLRRATGYTVNFHAKARISIHALLAESDRFNPLKTLVILAFLSTLSLRRATSPASVTPAPSRNFYPRSPCGERPGCQRPCGRPTRDFYPRSPCGERPHNPKISVQFTLISIHALLAESDHYDNYNLHCVDISIHALLAESDPKTFQAARNRQRISIHALLAESDIYGFWMALNRPLFLSTLSLRRATLGNVAAGLRMSNFYPRSPCGERRYRINAKYTKRAISIHALLAESDASIFFHLTFH